MYIKTPFARPALCFAVDKRFCIEYTEDIYGIKEGNAFRP